MNTEVTFENFFFVHFPPNRNVSDKDQWITFFSYFGTFFWWRDTVFFVIKKWFHNSFKFLTYTVFQLSFEVNHTTFLDCFCDFMSIIFRNKFLGVISDPVSLRQVSSQYFGNNISVCLSCRCIVFLNLFLYHFQNQQLSSY